MKASNDWYVIINPTSGNGASQKKWPEIQKLLGQYEFDFDFAFSEFKNHSVQLAQDAINTGFRKIISVGGDGTLHNIINGIMGQSHVQSSEIVLGVIPIGTGNDWVRTYAIPNQVERAIQIIKNGLIKTQDLGKIDFLSAVKTPVYFNNLAGMGFDGYVVKQAEKFKKYGGLAYLIAGLSALFSFRNFQSKIEVNSEVISTKSLMILIGLCRYSGGGMQLTHAPNPNDGLLDISVLSNITKWDFIRHISKLYKGRIDDISKVKTFKTSDITISSDHLKDAYIQADGEFIGHEAIRISLIPQAFSFYCK